MATKKEYEMLFALEAQLGREFRATFQKARDEFKDTAVGAESFGDKATEAVDVLSSALAAAGMSAALGKLKDLFDECTQASMDFESTTTALQSYVNDLMTSKVLLILLALLPMAVRKA